MVIETISAKVKIILFFLILVFGLSSCVYYPHLANIPLMEKKGDLQINAGVGMSPINGSVTYSPIKNYSVMVHGTGLKSNNKSIQCGLGYYNRLGNGLIYETYGLYNRGKGEGYRVPDDPDLRAFDSYYDETNFNQYAIQFNIGKRLTAKRNIEYAFSLKTFFWDSHGYYITGAKSNNYIRNKISDNAIGIEPQISFKVGGEYLKFYIQAGYCGLLKFTNKDLPKNGFLMPLNLGIGLSSRFNLNKDD